MLAAIQKYSNPMRYFHNTDAILKPGDIVTSAKTRKTPSRWGPNADRYDPSVVYLLDENAGPEHYTFGYYIYEVMPEGKVSPDPEKGMYLDTVPDQLRAEEDWDDEASDPAKFSWITPQARVIRKVDAPLV